MLQKHAELQTKAFTWDTAEPARPKDMLLQGKFIDKWEEWSKDADKENKKPKITPLQKEYVKTSRDAFSRRKRIVGILGTMALALIIAGTITAAVMAVLAVQRQQQAQAAQAQAEAAQVVADANARNATEQAVIADVNARNATDQAAQADAARVVADANARNATAQAVIAEAQAVIAGREALSAELQLLSFRANMLIRQSHGRPDSTFASVEDTVPIKAILHGLKASISNNLTDPVLTTVMQQVAYGVLSNLSSYLDYIWQGTHSGAIISPIGSKLALTSESGSSIEVWDLDANTTAITSSTPSATLDVSVGSKPLVMASFSPDGAMLATFHLDYSVMLWNLSSPSPFIIWTPYTFLSYFDFVQWGPCSLLAWSPNGSMIASAASDNLIFIWDMVASVTSGNPVLTLSGHQTPVAGLSWSPDGHYLATISSDSTPTSRVWDITTGRKQQDSTVTTSIPVGRAGTAGTPECVAWSKMNVIAISALELGTLQLWDASQDPNSSHYTITFLTDVMQDLMQDSPQYYTYNLIFSPDGYSLATTAESAVVVWQSLFPQNYSILSKASRYSWFASNHPWYVLDPYPLILPGTGSALSVSFSPDGRHLASGWVDGVMRMWNLDQPKTKRDPIMLRVDVGHANGTVSERVGDGLYYVAWRPDGKQLAVATNFATVEIWDFIANTSSSMNNPIMVLYGHSPGYIFTSLVWGPKPNFVTGDWLLASANSDGTIRIWTIPSAQGSSTPTSQVVVDNIMLGGGFFASTWLPILAWHPDGQRLVIAGTYDCSVHLYLLSSGNLIRLAGAQNDTNFYSSAVSFSQDGQFLAVGYSNALGHGDPSGDVEFWSVGSAVNVYRVVNLGLFLATAGGPEHLAFSADSQYLAATDQTGMVLVLNLANMTSPFLSLIGLESGLSSLGWSADGRRLMTLGVDKVDVFSSIHIWDLSAFIPASTPLSNNLNVYSYTNYTIANHTINGINRYYSRFMVDPAAIHNVTSFWKINTGYDGIAAALSPDSSMVAYYFPSGGISGAPNAVNVVHINMIDQIAMLEGYLANQPELTTADNITLESSGVA